MSDNKHIDRLFQEKLKDFEASPSPEAWQAISSKLQRKKRRVLPLWWWYGGIAAVLVVGLIWYGSNRNTDITPNTNEPIIVVAPEVFMPTDTVEQVITEQKTPVEKTEESKNALTTKRTNHKKKKNITTILVAQNRANLVSEKNAEKDNMSTDKIKEDNLSVDPRVVPENLTITTKTPKKKTTPKDTVVVFTSKKDFIAQVQQQESDTKKKTTGKKWAITPVVAVLRSNSFSNSSPIDKSLAAMPTNGANSISYGVKISYQINSKWSVQSGIHQQNIDYLTKNLTVVSNVIGGNLSNVEYSDAGYGYSIEANNYSSTFALSAGASVLTSNAALSQTYGYIEIPIEIKYTLIENKKFNTQIVAGMSSLFLNKNTLSVTTPNTALSLGKANNLNTINFSSNFGLDLDYSFHKKWKLNLNPMFKVHLNTFSKNANGFRPYSLGVYTGITYNF